jgi:hypothetical protein
MSHPPKELWKSFIDAHQDLELLDSGKVRCKITGHEMKPTKDVVDVSNSPKRKTGSTVGSGGFLAVDSPSPSHLFAAKDCCGTEILHGEHIQAARFPCILLEPPSLCIFAGSSERQKVPQG